MHACALLFFNCVGECKHVMKLGMIMGLWAMKKRQANRFLCKYKYYP